MWIQLGRYGWRIFTVATIAIVIISPKASGQVNPNQANVGRRTVASEDVATKRVQLSARIIKEEYRLLSLENDYRRVLVVELELSLINTSRERQIVFRYPGEISHVVLASDKVRLGAKHFEYEAWTTFRRLKLDNTSVFPEAAPTESFAVLDPGQSFTAPATIQIILSSSDESTKTIRPGEYVLSLRLSTWFWGTEKAIESQSLWKQYGNLFYDDLIMDAMPIRVHPATK
jgi:hypothetical protein